MSAHKDITPAFPVVNADPQSDSGMLLRDWFATFAPEPTDKAIETQGEQDRMTNPHGDHYKPKRRSRLEIVCDLRYAYADMMMERRSIERDR